MSLITQKVTRWPRVFLINNFWLLKMKMHNNFKIILRSRFLVNLEKRQFVQSAISFRRFFKFFFLTFLLNDNIILKQYNKKGSPGLFSCKSLRRFHYSHARRHAFKNLDFIRSAITHELFWLPLTASCARVGERAPNMRFLLFAAKTSFTVVVVVKDNLLGLLCRIFTEILGRFIMFCESFIRSRWLSRSIELPLKLGKHWIPETIFLKYAELTKVVLAVKASFICEFRLQQYKSDLARKNRAAIFLLVFAPLSCVLLMRDARW